MRDDRDDEDFLLWILRRCVDAMPNYAASGNNTIFEIERMVRQTLGGTRHYIAKNTVAARAGWRQRRDRHRG